MYGGRFQVATAISLPPSPDWPTVIRFFRNEWTLEEGGSGARVCAGRAGVERVGQRSGSHASERHADLRQAQRAHRRIARTAGWMRRRSAPRSWTIYEESVHYLLYQRYHRPFRGGAREVAFLSRIPGGLEHAVPDPGQAFRERARSQRTCSPASGRSSGRFITSTTTSSATRCRRRDCGPASGNPSSRTTCGATGACCTAGWASFPR